MSPLCVCVPACGWGFHLRRILSVFFLFNALSCVLEMLTRTRCSRPQPRIRDSLVCCSHQCVGLKSQSEPCGVLLLCFVLFVICEPACALFLLGLSVCSCSFVSFWRCNKGFFGVASSGSSGLFTSVRFFLVMERRFSRRLLLLVILFFLRSFLFLGGK